MTEQTLESVGTFGKSFFDFLNLYAKILVTYTGGLIFLLYGCSIFIERSVPLSMQSKLIFFGVALLFLFISYLIRRGGIPHYGFFQIVIWFGNVFGFLFNIIYAVVSMGNIYGYAFSFGGIERYIFYKDHDNFNMIENIYGFVGGMLFIITMSLISMYGLSLRDKFKKEGRKLMMLWGYFVAVMGGFSFFLIIFPLAAHGQSVFMYIIKFVTGSILFIYGTNLFSNRSWFLKFEDR